MIIRKHTTKILTQNLANQDFINFNKNEIQYSSFNKEFELEINTGRSTKELITSEDNNIDDEDDGQVCMISRMSKLNDNQIILESPKQQVFNNFYNNTQSAKTHKRAV